MKSSRNDSNPGPGNYSVSDYNTIEKPIVTGGAPANEFAFKKHERMKSERLANPFKTSDLSREKTVVLETANLGPGLYYPEKGEIGGSTLHKSKMLFYQTQSGSKELPFYSDSFLNKTYFRHGTACDEKGE